MWTAMAIGTLFSTRGALKVFCTLSPRSKPTRKTELQTGRDTRQPHTAAPLHAVEVAVSGIEQLLNRAAILRKDGRSYAHGNGRIFSIGAEPLADAFAHAARGLRAGFRKHQSKLITAVTRGGIDGAGVHAKNVAETADGVRADQMAVAIVDLLEIVEIHQDYGEAASATAGALDFALEGVQQGTIIAQAGERIADGEPPHLLEKTGIIEQCAAQDQGIAGGTQAQGQSEWRIKRVQRLRGRDMACDVNPKRDAERALEAEASQVGAVKGDRRHEEQRRRKQLRGARQPSRGKSGRVDNAAEIRGAGQVSHD